jgi:hypothetical protein
MSKPNEMNTRSLAGLIADKSVLDKNDVLQMLMTIDVDEFIGCATNEQIAEYLDGQGYDVLAP